MGLKRIWINTFPTGEIFVYCSEKPLEKTYRGLIYEQTLHLVTQISDPVTISFCKALVGRLATEGLQRLPAAGLRSRDATRLRDLFMATEVEIPCLYGHS